MLALGLALPAQAQEVETVVVTGQRAAIESAIAIKRNADSIVDSIAADDIGKLPDNSVTEVLQRMVGVNISHMSVGHGSEDYLGEGTNVTIRGLGDSAGMLNGRDSFSSNSGRTLSWEDIPPELFQGIDVYKSLMATLPEGGFGGVVNLRTRQPFDFDGFAAYGTLGGSFADYARKGNLSGSFLVSDRVNTKIGEFGLLVNISYSDLSSKSDGMQLSPYYPAVYNPGYASANPTGRLPVLSDTGSSEVYLGNGMSFSRDWYNRKRMGFYAAAQWRLSDQLEFFATAFRSRYTANKKQITMSFGSGGDAVTGAGSTNTFDADGNLTYTSGLSDWGQYGTGDGPVWNGDTYSYLPYTTTAGTNQDINQTSDLSIGGEWHPSDKFSAKLAVQYVDSSANTHSNTANLNVVANGYGLTLTPYGDSGLAQLNASDSAVDLGNYANYTWTGTMPHLAHNFGREVATYLDTVYDFSNTGFFRQLRSGFKLAVRSERDQDNGYNYQNLSGWWSTDATKKLSADPSLGQKIMLGDFFGGTASLPAAVWFPTFAATNDPVMLQSLYGTTDTQAATVRPMNQYDLSKVNETQLTAYAMLTFDDSGISPVPFDGNIGLRLVGWRDGADGWRKSPNFTNQYVEASQAVKVSAVEQDEYVIGRHQEVDVLPSFNIRFKLSDKTNVRLAASQGLNRPSFGDINPKGQVYCSDNTGGNGWENYCSTGWGNINLKPEKADQFDISLEHYFENGGNIVLAGFYKRIHNYWADEKFVQSYAYPVILSTDGSSDGSFAASTACTANTGSTTTGTCTVNLTTSQRVNETGVGEIRGFEFSFSKYADFLPDPYNGLGMNFNFTYIDSAQPDARAYDMTGAKITGLPLNGLSKDTFNAQLMYDKEDLSVRIAYNWRSRYMVTTNAYQLGGTYKNKENGSSPYDIITYAIPLFQYPSGTIDAGLDYKLTDDVSWSLSASNLTRTMTRTYMMEGHYSDGRERLYNRSWYYTDVRYSTQLRFKF